RGVQRAEAVFARHAGKRDHAAAGALRAQCRMLRFRFASTRDRTDHEEAPRRADHGCPLSHAAIESARATLPHRAQMGPSAPNATLRSESGRNAEVESNRTSCSRTPDESTLHASPRFG